MTRMMSSCLLWLQRTKTQECFRSSCKEEVDSKSFKIWSEEAFWFSHVEKWERNKVDYFFSRSWFVFCFQGVIIIGFRYRYIPVNLNLKKGRRRDWRHTDRQERTFLFCYHIAAMLKLNVVLGQQPEFRLHTDVQCGLCTSLSSGRKWQQVRRGSVIDYTDYTGRLGQQHGQKHTDSITSH